MVLVASSPDWFGILRSINTRSGSSDSVLSITSTPSTASPTTSTPGIALIYWLSSCLKLSLSSQSKTLTFFLSIVVYYKIGYLIISCSQFLLGLLDDLEQFLMYVIGIFADIFIYPVNFRKLSVRLAFVYGYHNYSYIRKLIFNSA